MAYRRIARSGYSEMNLTNLIDVVFCLLIVFMLTAPLMTQGVKVDLPKVEAANIEEREAIRVSIDRKRRIYIDEDQVSLFDFEKEFRQVFSSAKPRSSLIPTASCRMASWWRSSTSCRNWVSRGSVS